MDLCIFAKLSFYIHKRVKVLQKAINNILMPWATNLANTFKLTPENIFNTLFLLNNYEKVPIFLQFEKEMNQNIKFFSARTKTIHRVKVE